MSAKPQSKFKRADLSTLDFEARGEKIIKLENDLEQMIESYLQLQAAYEREHQTFVEQVDKLKKQFQN